MWPVEFGLRRVAVELLWLLTCIAGLKCKALSLGNGQFSGETLPVLPQKIKIVKKKKMALVTRGSNLRLNYVIVV